MGFKKTKATIVLAFGLLIFAVFSISGCAFKDIDKRAFVTAIGIDESDSFENKFKITLKISLSKGDPSTTGAQFTLLTYDANSISEALKHLKSMTDKELFFGQTETILIGEKMAVEDIRPLLDYFVRKADIQRTAYLSVAAPTAHKVLEFQPKVEQVAGSYIFSLFEESSVDSPYTKALTLFDAYRRVTEEGINIAMPIIEIREDRIQVDSIALLSKVRMEFQLNPRESELYRLLTAGIKNGSTNIDTKEGAFSINIFNGKAKYKIENGNDNMPSVIFSIKLKATIEEKLDRQINLSKEQITKIQNETERKMKEEVKSLLDTIQKTKLDPIGFGLKYNATNYQHRNLNDFYSNLKFKVKVNCRINEAGIVD